ncbi:MAG: glutamine--fructose-6-phosphate aminotransferase, partial [Heliobacteriaceae bacterium]|nr:glutamine--fructose-6-phosphate aminotransferase [Heliobacteriaceae bacterium]
MCGITGYIGREQAVPVLMRGLTDLAVRGYDSAGIAVLDDNAGLRLEKSEGKLERLQARLADGWSGRIGIGHTRWATHGRPADVNAHPHTDCSGKFAVVHNGIIENHQTLRNWLVKEGHQFLSETDTEVLPHLVEHFYQGNLLAAVGETIARVEGFYAVAFMSAHEPDRLVAVRRGSPLAIGLGQNAYYLASDISLVLPYTR